MNLDSVRKIADAVLYEGSIRYPYRAPARKNHSRWRSGVVMAPGYAAADPAETSATRAECVLEHAGRPAVRVIVRFLQVQRRTAGDRTRDEVVEREVEVSADSAALFGDGVTQEFTVAGGEDREEGVVWRREPLAGAVSVRTAQVPGPWRAVRLQVRVENRTRLGSVPSRREEALPTALVAAHAIIIVSGGEFISMTDPPEWARPAVDECRNEDGWPVLADPDGGRHVVLSAPIILHDHPEVAAEPAVPWWDPDAEDAVSPGTDSVTIGGQPVARGSRVRLRPGARRADAQDMFLVGRIAEVQAVLYDVDDHPYLAVSLADQPDEDLRVAHGRFLYFSTDEVEPLEVRP